MPPLRIIKKSRKQSKKCLIGRFFIFCLHIYEFDVKTFIGEQRGGYAPSFEIVLPGYTGLAVVCDVNIPYTFR
jgi:hypothetical protein